jgi:hypothetical protein
MWDELGIAPSDDPKMIRRAYAARLKQLNPDRDPAAFGRLRKALELALALATPTQTPTPRPASEPEPREPPAEDFVPPTETLAPRTNYEDLEADDIPVAVVIRQGEGFPHPLALPDDRDRALLAALDAALKRGDAGEATKLYYRASATGALSLRGAPDVLERVFAVIVEAPNCDPAALRELAKCAGWDRPADPDVPELRRDVLARLAAEDWYDSLVARADRGAWTARRQVKVARLMLGRIGRHWMPRFDKAALRVRLDEYAGHEKWLRDRIRPEWADTLERRLHRRERISLAFLCVFILALLVQGVVVFWIEFSKPDWSLWLLLGAPIYVAFLLWILKALVIAMVRPPPRRPPPA